MLDQPADPFLDVAELARMQRLRALRSDDAVTLADLTFAIDVHDRLADNLDIIRANAAHAALTLAARRRQSGHAGDALRWAVPAGLSALVILVVLLVVQAL